MKVSGEVKASIKNFITFRGFMTGGKLTVLEEDGCNNNKIPREFATQNEHLLHICKSKSALRLSKKDLTETASEIVPDA